MAGPAIGSADFEQAEQFVHGQIYNSMVQVWNTDRRAWNKLLQVHACGGDNQPVKLSESYESAQPLFAQAIVNYAKTTGDAEFISKRAVLEDVSQLAYRLFSMSFAHGYARQVQLADKIEPGIHQELCGMEGELTPEALINYAPSMDWKLDKFTGQVDKDLFSSRRIFERHAKHGYSAFNQLLAQQYDSFDALIYSHAYQNTEAYTQLFFEVNGYDNVISYQNKVNQLATGSKVSVSEDEAEPHVDFAFLVLSSGYHWGTISVLAMLEEEYPRLHDKTREIALNHIQSTLDEQASVDSTGR